MSELFAYKGIDVEVWQSLLTAAKVARDYAYAPYSNFKVGAAILHEDGSIVVGVNVENATYGATCCAERTAVQTSVTEGKLKFKAICVVTGADRAVAPCGVCRQVLAEFSSDLPVLMANMDGESEFACIDELLPHQFSSDDL